jgi:hypothetical protein
MSKIVAPLLIATLLAACAPAITTPAPASSGSPLPIDNPVMTPVTPAAAKLAPVAATAPLAKAPIAAKPAAAKPATLTPAAKPVAAAPTLTKAPTDFKDLDIMAAFTSLPASAPSGPDEVDDDSDLESSSFSTKFWFGWWGLDGRERALRAFTREEGRPVAWEPYAGGWTALRPYLSPMESLMALAIAAGPLHTRTPVQYSWMPRQWRSNTTRHLKLYRRQNVVDLKSRDLAFYAVYPLFSTTVAGYIARAESGADKYVAYYDHGGRLWGAYGTSTATAGSQPAPAAVAPSATP